VLIPTTVLASVRLLHFTLTLLSLHKLLLLLHLRFFHHSKPGELIAMVLQVAIAVLCRHYFHLVSPLDYTNDILVDSGITARIDSPISILACFYHESPSAGPYFSNRLLNLL
jgi:hypothetical protein